MVYVEIFENVAECFETDKYVVPSIMAFVRSIVKLAKGDWPSYVGL